LATRLRPDADARVAEDPVTNAIVFNTGQDPLHLPGFPFLSFTIRSLRCAPTDTGFASWPTPPAPRPTRTAASESNSLARSPTRLRST